MHMYIYTHIHRYVYVDLDISVHMYLYIHMGVHIYTYVYTDTYTNLYPQLLSCFLKRQESLHSTGLLLRNLNSVTIIKKTYCLLCIHIMVTYFIYIYIYIPLKEPFKGNLGFPI